ncbi:ABC transporter substrate-binding protein [Micromonospora sp. 067-2]|uniref:ABC transporter substrate-binding protein n=1 Tax=Micromonospora sp. 067-2 TaxID=2789270 RepID=UPI00397D2A1D
MSVTSQPATVPTGTLINRRHLLRGSLGAVGLATLGGGALSACAPSASTSGTAAKNAAITIMGDPGDHKAELLAAFTKETGTRTEFLKFDFTRLSAMIAGGNPPDVVKGLGTTDTPYLAARRLAHPLDDYLAKSSLIKADDLLPVQDLWRFDGARQGAGPRYGLVKDYSQDSMHWVNSALYGSAGVRAPSDTEPTSYDELLETARRLTRSKSGQTSVYGLGGYNDIGMGYLSQQIATFGGSFFNDAGDAVDFSTPEGQRILQWWLDVVAAKVSYNPVNPAPDGWDASVYQAGRIATYMSGYWFQGMIAENKGVLASSKLVAAPVFGSKRVSPTAAAVGHWIPAKSRNKDAAWAYLEWYNGGQPAKDRAGSGWGLPALKSMQQYLPRGTAQYQQSYDAEQRELPYFGVVPWTPYVKIDAFETVMRQEFKRAITGRSTGGKLADALNGALNPLIRAEKAKVS